MLVGWGAAVIFVRLAEPDLNTSGLYLAGAAAGALAGLELARHSFAVDPVTVAATAILAGAVLAVNAAGPKCFGGATSQQVSRSKGD